MAHPVKCKYCGQTFDRDKVEHVQVSKARYAHIECYKEQQLSISQEERDLEELRDYFLINLRSSFKIRSSCPASASLHSLTFLPAPR